MNIGATSPAPEFRTRLRWIVAAVALTLVSAGVVIDHVSLSHLIRKTADTARRSDVAALQGRLSTVDEQLAEIRHRPAAVAQADLSAARQALYDRLENVEQVLKDSARANDLLPLQTRLEQVEARLEKAHQAHPPASRSARHHSPGATRPQIVEPPFALLGTELRGGEPFLSIAATGSQSLTQVRLLHPGESEGNWQLEALDGKTATFRVDGHMRPITVP